MEVTAVRIKPALLIVGGLVAVIGVVACTGSGQYQSDFPVVVENRTINTIQVLANGNQIGQVDAGQAGSFSLRLPESNPNILTNGVAPTPQAQVVFSAKDLKTGTISTTKSVTLSQTPPAYVTFNAVDFPAAVRTVASFNFSPANPGINQDVFFNASSSTGSNNTYAWAFGDGTTGAGVMVTHQYSQVATFNVTLTAASDNGQTSTQSRAVNVSASLSAAAALFTFSPRTPATNQDVIFTAVTVMAGQTYSWDFGDGLNGTGATVTHRFTRASIYTVQLRVSNAVGQSATTSQLVPVTAALPGNVSFVFSPTTPGVNDDVFFTAAASTVTGATFTWDFGDGSRSSGLTTTHRFSRATTYTVTLTAANDVGQSATTSRTIPVSATSSQVVARFTFSPTTPSVGDDVFFNASSSTATNGTADWDFGDGARGVGVAPTHRYSRATTYTVTLTVTNDIGQSATTSLTITVSPNSIAADFTFSPTNPRIATGTNAVIFDATPSSAGVTGWVWDFGDGSAGTGQRTSHTFSRAGTWVVRLTVTDATGRTATTIKNVPVID